MTTVPFEDLKGTYTELWARAEIKAVRFSEFKQVAARLASHKVSYVAVADATGVPWEMIAVIHEREASGSFNGCLANGDPWNRVTVNDPAGEGPWPSWFAAAVWALKHDGLAGHPKEFWTIERMLYYCEKFNGFGYWLYHNRMPSPYVWGGTTVQRPGKYVSDGYKGWRPDVMDGQLGCAGMLKILLDGTAPSAPVPPVPAPERAPSAPVPVVHKPAPTFWQTVLARLFGR